MEEEANLLSILQDVDAAKVGGVLAEVEKYEKIIDKVSGIVMRLNKIGVLPAVMRIAGQKSGITDIDKPLPQPSQMSVEAASPTHLLMFKELNKQPEEVLGEMLKQAILLEEKNDRKPDSKDRKG